MPWCLSMVNKLYYKRLLTVGQVFCTDQRSKNGKSPETGLEDEDLM